MLSYIMKLIRKLKKLFSNPGRLTIFKKVLYLDVTTEDVPIRLPEGTLCFVHGSGKPKWLKFVCPCGCEQEISLNLMKSYSPCWTIKRETDGTITVNPSVKIIEGCKSHFFIRNNKIDWCP